VLFVLAHEPAPDDRSQFARDLRVAADAARQSDLRVIRLPFPFPQPRDALPDTLPGELGVYSGPIPQHFEHYASLEREVAARGGRMVNTAVASEQASRIDLWHERLGRLTARTVIVRGESDLETALTLGLPLFVRGLVKSAKERGLEACLIPDADALRARAEAAWARGQTIAAREYLPLRQTGEIVMGFPHAREYRFILLDRDVLSCAYYWGREDPLSTAATDDNPPVALAVSASQHLDARLVAVDVGQLEDGSWRVIEVGDAQHTGLVHIPPHRYWITLREQLP
jgi:hypothetical protein